MGQPSGKGKGVQQTKEGKEKGKGKPKNKSKCKGQGRRIVLAKENRTHPGVEALEKERKEEKGGKTRGKWKGQKPSTTW